MQNTNRNFEDMSSKLILVEKIFVYFKIIYCLGQSANKAFLSDNNSESVFNNTAIISSENYSEENKETVVKVPKNKKTLKKWIFLGIILILIIAVGISIVIITKLSSNRHSSGTFNTSDIIFINIL